MKGCPNESNVLYGKKSYCTAWKCWTNCREVNHCVRDKYQKRKEAKQLTLF